MTFRERREKHRSKRKKKETVFIHGVIFCGMDLFYFPELLFLPFRLLWWGLRAILKIFRFDFW